MKWYERALHGPSTGLQLSEQEQKAEYWIAKHSTLVADLESRLGAKRIPILRGGMNADGGFPVIDVDCLDAATLDLAADETSLCVLEIQQPTLPLQGNAKLRDLDIYIRLGLTSTWLHYAAHTPEDDPVGDEDDDSLSIDGKATDRYAIRVAESEGFGSLRNVTERMTHARHVLGSEQVLNDQDIYHIARTAESLYSLGVAPTLAKELESQGKSVGEIAKTLGITRVRVDRALATKTPAHIAKLVARPKDAASDGS